MPDIVSPDLHWLADEEADLNDYLKDPTNPVVCLPPQNEPLYWLIREQCAESRYGEPGSTRNFWPFSVHAQLTLGMKMHSTAAFLSMPNQEGVVLGGPPGQGFNDNSASYPAWMTITTRQVTDVVMNDQDILAVKGGRQVLAVEPYLSDVDRQEKIRKVCASNYLGGYSESKVLDPIQLHYPACTMPLAATTPAVITAGILCNPQYVTDYMKHVGLVRELLNQASLSVNPAVLAKCSDQILKSLAGLLTNESSCPLTREPIPAWNIVKVVRANPTAELVANTISLVSHDDSHLNVPSAPMPIPDTDQTSAMHPALVTELTMSKPYYRLGGLIPHLTREGSFWKSTRSAVHETILEYQLSLDPTDPARLKQMEVLSCGWVSSLPKIKDYNPTTGLHKTLTVDSVLGNPQYWMTKDGTTAKASSPAGPPSGGGVVQGLAQRFEKMSVRGGAQSPEMKTFLDEAFEPAEELHLKHDEITWEFYTGRHFAVPELIPGEERYHKTNLKLNALGGEFLWTLNHEVVFSTALTGRPKRKTAFSQYCWKRCAVGTTEEYGTATSKQEWELALMRGDLYSLQLPEVKDTMVLCPWNNTEYLNVAAYLEAFWGYIWPAVCHCDVPPHEEWSTNYHGGLKEFIDHAISTLGRVHLKPTTECLRGVVTYPTGHSTQGRFKMTLVDLQNEHYTVAVREAMMNLLLGRSDKDVQVGDVVEMLLSISFGVKDSMLDWTWLGIDPREWPPQRLDWEMYRLEHLAFASNMEAEMREWISYPWHVVYSALRCMAYRDWKRQHECPVCGVSRNNGSTHDAWAYMRGCLSHLDSGPKCIGSLLCEDPLNARGKSLIPSVAILLTELFPEKKARDWLPPMTILYMAPGGHETAALIHLREALSNKKDWNHFVVRDPRLIQCLQFLTNSWTLVPKWESTRLKILPC